MLNRIKKLFRKTEFTEGKRLVINVEKLERRLAVIEDGMVEEYSVERNSDENIVGSIFKGRVKNIEPGLKAMFVDIGFEKNAFLHFWDAIPAALDGGLEEISRNQGKKQKKVTSKDIPNIYPVGSEVLVQVTKGPIGTKGPRVTTNISLPGRYLVLMPLNEQFGISRKVEDPKERKRLRRIMEKLTVPEGMGVIMRTVCQGKRVRHFVRDLNILLEQWDEIDKTRTEKKAPVNCFQEPDLVGRVVRDLLTEEIDEIICDDEPTTEFMREQVSQISRRTRNRIRYFQSGQPLFDKLGIQRQIDDAFHRQVWLPCGGYLVIDETEAMITVDVNTGRNRGGKNIDKTILETNLEAAVEVARQLRLRNIGGLVVIDFIDMKGRRDQNQVYKVMRERLKRDRAKTQVMQISPLGLMEMTRQRLTESLSDSLYDPCPYCAGKGRLKSLVTMSVELQRKLGSVIDRHRDKAGDMLIVIHPDVMNRLRTEDQELLADLERRHTGRLTFRSDPALHREVFKISDANTGKELS
ncbi:Rne/Rng family ribonuclease [Sulfuriroseicoccus oceanibius]|uniref:Rne/Rng family ribonuclease n=1 Tax=Sulfuriroseicoccus oceanibius TaxID=2707525 RepID=A0A6B3L8B4_9BACT|nr:Rne/Rng family ribonuclease [Sulfuriroseicoccus oceanibius]QQL43750.1 Rne/Rng family ribonuclease [Sulfuriroseicoccus oceanibius]